MRGDGIGGYDLKSDADKAFAFDYQHSGKMDHVVLYRPGSGTTSILKNSGGKFTPAYQAGTMGNYDMKGPADRAFAFDFEHSGKRDYIVAYRPGTGIFRIMQIIEDGTPKAAYAPPGDNNGIPTIFDLKDGRDRAFALDYDHSGKMDYILVYRPGGHAICIIKNTEGTLSAVYNKGEVPYSGWHGIGPADIHYSHAPIGSWTFIDNADRAFPYDFDGSGKMDHVVLYRPGQGRVHVMKNLMGGWHPVFQSDSTGIATYDVKSGADRCIPFDYESSGRLDHILIFRAGQKLVTLVKRSVPPKPEAQAAPAATAEPQADSSGWGQQWQDGWQQPANQPPPGVW